MGCSVEQILAAGPVAVHPATSSPSATDRWRIVGSDRAAGGEEVSERAGDPTGRTGALHGTTRCQRFDGAATRVALSCLTVLLVLPTWAAACPGCKEALFDPAQLPQKLATAKAYAVSIGVMLAVPTLLIGGLTALIVSSVRHRRSTR